MKFSRWVFWIAGIYGVIVLVPHYFMEQTIGVEHPPAITHPEFFYGFVGVAIAWQIAFLIIGSNPQRYRPMMIPCMLEKLSFAAAVVALFWTDRVPATTLAAGMIDLTWCVLFFIAWLRLGRLSPA